MAKLIDLGFLKGVIAETIVSTYNSDGKPKLRQWASSWRMSSVLPLTFSIHQKPAVTLRQTDAPL